MKKFYGNYLGLCINNDDPQKRGRIQVFIPHIMPALFENWNEVGEDIKMLCVGDNLPDSLPSPVVEKLMKILPWAESASPILGTSSPGNLISNAINTIAGAAIPVVGAAQAVAGAINNFFNESPKPDPIDGSSVGGYIPGVTGIGNESALLNEALKYAGGGNLGNIVRSRLTTPGSRGGGACGRGTVAVVGALTGNSRFTQGTAGGNAQDFSLNGGSSFAGSGIYNNKQSLPSNYLNDSSQWRVGDIVAADSNGYGHIQVFTGKGWVSDFQQGNKVLTNGYSGFALHRLNASGEAAVAARADLFGGLVGGSGQTPPSESSIGLERTSNSGQVAAPTPHQDENSVQVDTEQNNYGSIARPEVQSTASETTINKSELNLTSSHKQGLNSFLQNYNTNKSKYDAVSAGLAANGINMKPSQVAALHWREASGSFTGSIANGQSITSFVRRDGRIGNGSSSNSYTPTSDWVSHSVEVLTHKVGEKKVGNNLSSPSTFNTFAERFNGLGYRNRGSTSPYVYAGTNAYTGGKFTADGVYNPNVFDKQVGTAVLAAAAEGTLDTEGVDISSLPRGVTEDSGASTNASTASQSLIQNTDKHGSMAVVNLNNMAKGVFSYPAAGAVLWVFFREGDPNFPVYFAANYGEREWQSAYRMGSDAPGYKPAPTPENPVTSTGGMMNLNGVGGMRWEDTSVPDDPTKDQKSLTLFGYDGSNMHFNEGYHQIFSKFDRRDSVEGDRWETTLGFKEEWVQGDSNEVTMGDVFVKIGNVSPPAVDAVTRIQQIIKECMEPVTQSSGSTPSTSTAGKSEFSKTTAAASPIKATPIGAPPSRTGGQTDSPSQIIANIRKQQEQAEMLTRGTYTQRQQQEAAARESGFAR